MKRLLPFILIATILFPVLGHAASAPAVQTPITPAVDLNNPVLQGKTLAEKQKDVSNGLYNIYNQLTGLSNQTQVTIGQLSGNGLNTDKAQADLVLANTSLAKAKLAITAFSSISTTKYSATGGLDSLKYSANNTEKVLREAKNHLLASLTDLKAILPTLDTTDQS